MEHNFRRERTMEATDELLTVLIPWRNEVLWMVWSGSRDKHQMPYFYFCQQTSFTCINVFLVKLHWWVWMRAVGYFYKVSYDLRAHPLPYAELHDQASAQRLRRRLAGFLPAATLFYTLSYTLFHTLFFIPPSDYSHTKQATTWNGIFQNWKRPSTAWHSYVQWKWNSFGVWTEPAAISCRVVGTATLVQRGTRALISANHNASW